jgi:MFS family permease
MNGVDTSFEDYKARNQEIQQLVAHRFQLTTLAILVFSGIAGWLTTYLANPVNDPNFLISGLLPTVSLLLLSILAVLYYEYFALLRTLRIFSTYLFIKFPTQWEADWKKYREHPLTKKYPGYSKAGFRIFSVLGVLSVVYPSFFLIPYRKLIKWAYAAPLLAVVVLLLVVFLWLLYRTTYHQDEYTNEIALIEGWRLIIPTQRDNTPRGGESC